MSMTQPDETITNNFTYEEANPKFEHSKKKCRRLPYTYSHQKLRLIWLNPNNDRHERINQFKNMINNIDIFNNVKQCHEFLMKINDENIFVIISGSFIEDILPVVHDLYQVQSVFIHCEDKSISEQNIKPWQKVKGIFRTISSIHELLKKTIEEIDQDSISISFFQTDGPCNELNQSFMYTQILKEIVLGIDFNQSHIKDFLFQFREQFDRNNSQLNFMNIFEKNYLNHTPIWWYTEHCFVGTMLNRALRMMDITVLIQMGFYLCDLHHQIEQLHSEQFSSNQQKQSFTVYRGQGLSACDFEQLMKMKGRLISFNNFLSTSVDRDIALAFMESNEQDFSLKCVLFEIYVDPTVKSTPFANINEISSFQTENEILFSMHSIFRIEEINEINQLWHVKVILTGDSDQELISLSKQMKNEILLTTNRWHQLGQFLIKIGQFDKAERIYKVMLDQSSNDEKKAMIYHMYGLIKVGQGEYREAIEFHKTSIEILENNTPTNYFYLVISYNNVASTYNILEEYSKALDFYEKALEILQKNFPSNYPHIAACFNDIGFTFNKMKEYSNALSYHKRALGILQENLSSNHPSLAISFSYIGSVYRKLHQYFKALSSYEKSLEIRRKSLPSYDNYVIISYHEIGSTYDEKGELSIALSFYEKAFEIQQKSLPPYHPNFTNTYAAIGSIYQKVGEYSKALSFYEKALEIHEKNQSPNHPNLAITYDNIGRLYYQMDELSKALAFHEKALHAFKKILTSNHPDMAITLNNIGGVYWKMNDYFKALSFYENALTILLETFSPSHPTLATFYDNISAVYFKIEDYSQAFSFNSKAIEIFECLDSHYSDLSIAYNNASDAYFKLGDYSVAMRFCERAIHAGQRSLSPDHPYLKLYKNKLESIRIKQEITYIHSK